MPVYKPDGDIVPVKPYHDSAIIDSYWMPYDEFAELEEVFCQRNTEGRLSRAQKHLSKLMPEHVVVFLAKLTKKDEVLAFQVENRINKRRGLFDLFVRKKDVNDTLTKALAWAEEEEEYELCQRIKNLEDFLAKQIMF